MAKPVISASGGAVTVTCSTPGATIYLSIDGSRPTTAVSWASGVSPLGAYEINDWGDLSATTVAKARAYLSGWRGSELARLDGAFDEEWGGLSGVTASEDRGALT